MSLGIIVDDLDKVVDRLKNGDFDDTEFALDKYDTTKSTVEINDEDVPLIQGEVTYPRGQFAVAFDDLLESSYNFDSGPPGILPYAASSYQTRDSATDPAPREVGMPAFSNESRDRVGIKWLFGIGGHQDPFTPWSRLDESDVDDLPSFKKPSKEEVTGTREGQSIYGGQAHPEDAEIVRDRIEDCWWEVWNARCQELMDTWRVLVPVGSINPRPLLFSPAETIVSNNFNLVLCPDGNTAVAVAAVLATDKIKEEILHISPWSKGGSTGTPRPGVKHISVLLDRHKGIIEELIDDKGEELYQIADDQQQFHKDLLEVLNQYVQVDYHSGNTLRGYHTGTSDADLMDSEIEGIADSGTQTDVMVQTTDGDVTIGFHDQEYASSLAIGAWLGAGFDDTIDDVFNLPAVETDRNATQNALLNKALFSLAETVEQDYF